MASDNKTGLELRSLIKNSGELELSLASVPIPEPGPDEVLVRVEAVSVNPVLGATAVFLETRG